MSVYDALVTKRLTAYPSTYQLSACNQRQENVSAYVENTEVNLISWRADDKVFSSLNSVSRKFSFLGILL